MPTVFLPFSSASLVAQDIHYDFASTNSSTSLVSVSKRTRGWSMTGSRDSWSGWGALISLWLCVMSFLRCGWCVGWYIGCCAGSGFVAATASFCPKSIRSLWGCGCVGWIGCTWSCLWADDKRSGSFDLGWPRRIGATSRICWVLASGVGPSLHQISDVRHSIPRLTNISALRIQSRSSSPSSDPPGPPWTFRKSLGCHSTPFSALLAASSRCISSTLVFSSVAASWLRSFMAITVLYHNFWDSRSSCSSNGRTIGAECLALVASNRTSLWPVYTGVSRAPIQREEGRFYQNIS